MNTPTGTSSAAQAHNTDDLAERNEIRKKPWFSLQTPEWLEDMIHGKEEKEAEDAPDAG